MPFIHVRIQAPVTAGQISQLQHEITALMERVLAKRASLTSVLVDVSTADWSIGGETVQIAAHMQAFITAGTNTAEEKAAFIDAANRLMRNVAGPELPVATYVILQEIAADAWGYDGMTQGARRSAVPAA